MLLFDLCHRYCLGKEGSNEVLEAKLGAGLGIDATHSLGCPRHQETGRIVEPLTDEFCQQQLVALRVLYDAFLNSGNTLKCGSRSRTGAIDLGASSRSIRYPSQGLAEGLNAPSRYAAQRSTALPIDSSVRLL